MAIAKTITVTKSTAEQRQRKAAHTARYAPKPVVKTAPKNISETKQDPRLRRILVDTLDALKRPDAVPSKVIFEALEKAANLK